MRIASESLDHYLETHTPGQHMDPDLVANHEELIKQAGEMDRDALVKFGGGSSEERVKAMKATDKARPEKAIEGDLTVQYKDDNAEAVLDVLVESNAQFEAFREDVRSGETSKQDLISILAYNRAQEMPEEEEMLPARGGKGDASPHAEPEFWRYKGAALLKSPMAKILIKNEAEGRAPMWCDQATAITIQTLQAIPEFKSSLEVIRQGDPKQHGHWYVLANREEGESKASYGQALEGDQFIIDIWGALRLLEEEDAEIDSCVFPVGNQAVLNAAVSEDKDEAYKQNLLATLARFQEKE